MLFKVGMVVSTFVYEIWSCWDVHKLPPKWHTWNHLKQVSNDYITIVNDLTFSPPVSLMLYWNTQSGDSVAHCGPKPPTPIPPTPTVSPPTSAQDHDSRLIAYVGNWDACPSANQVAHYTHIVIAFAVSYQYREAKNLCNTSCDIAQPPVCGNNANSGLVSEWKRSGKKVILSFGGK